MGRVIGVLIAYVAIVGLLTVAGAIPKLPFFIHALLLVVANVAWPVLRPGILLIPLLGDLIATLDPEGSGPAQRS